jgi:hypothetical protein
MSHIVTLLNLISFHNLAWILSTMAADSGRVVVDEKKDNVLNTETEEKPVDDELARLKKDLELLKNAVSETAYLGTLI